MAFTVPAAVNYPSPLNAVPLDWLTPPVEGAKGIQCSIIWNAAGAGANKSVYLNLQNNATLNFSKVRALVFDNSENGSDVQVIFPDTETTVSIPAYTPYAVIPVFTNQTQFYITSPNALATDVTNFMVMNTLPPPIAVPTTQEQNFENSGRVNVSVSGNAVLLAAGVSGTLESVYINGIGLGIVGTAWSLDFSLVDGTGTTIFSGTQGGSAGANQPFTMADLGDIRVRFSQGLKMVWSTFGTPDSVFIAANVYYRTP